MILSWLNCSFLFRIIIHNYEAKRDLPEFLTIDYDISLNTLFITEQALVYQAGYGGGYGGPRPEFQRYNYYNEPMNGVLYCISHNLSY